MFIKRGFIGEDGIIYDHECAPKHALKYEPQSIPKPYWWINDDSCPEKLKAK